MESKAIPCNAWSTRMTVTEHRRGFTLLEQLLVVGMFALISTVLFVILHQGFGQLRALSSRSDAQNQLNRAAYWLKKDLERANPDQIGVKRVSSSTGAGDVIWFLSAEDPTVADFDERFRRNQGTARPQWQCHVIYYLIRPSDYAAVSNGGSASIDTDPRADYYAAHKFLIRKVVDRPGQEVLMTDGEIDAYTTAPANHDLSALLSEPGVQSCKVVADHMLSMEASLSERMLTLDLYAVQVAEAQRKVALGAVSLKDSPFTQHQLLRLILKN